MAPASYLDVVLVPTGLLILFVYHAQLIYRIYRFPTTTVIGLNQINRRAWVRTMMLEGVKNGVLAVQTLRNNIMAASLLATAAITICSVIAVLVGSGNYESEHRLGAVTLGDKSPFTASVKLLCVMACFLIAFLCNVQSVRYYSHVSFLISIPLGEELNQEYVNRSIIRGSYFWSMGLRAFYFSFPMFLWLFGPIPMFLCSAILSMLLHFLDTARDLTHVFGCSAKTSSLSDAGFEA